MDRFQQFRSLMQREWMQHRTGWLVLMLLPTLLLGLVGVLGVDSVQFDFDDGSARLPPLRELPPLLQTVGWTLAAGTITLVLAGLSVLGQLPGLARRDQQDRSIEFWRSLPTGHAQSIGATVLMHLLVLPGLAVTAALLGAQLVAALSVISLNGPLAWLQQPWWAMLLALLALLLRFWLGLLLAVLWLAPLLLLTMAAAAWLRRWAVPVLAAATLAGLYWLDARLPAPLVKLTLARLSDEALRALLAPGAFHSFGEAGAHGVAALLPSAAGLLWRDALAVLGHAASPAFAGALLVGGLCFGLLVLRRQRAD